VRRALGLFGVRLAAVVALAVCAALLVDYISSTPTFCGVGSGCAAVRGSGYGYLVVADLPVPVPALGLLAFALLLGVALARGLARWAPLIAGLGGAVGLGLFSLQLFKIGHLCSLCVTVDALAVVAAICGVVQWRGQGDANEPFGLRWAAWPLLALLAVLAPLAWPKLRPAAPVPAGVQKLYLPGKINVVEFADYECPFCRRLHPELKAVIASYPPGTVNFRRLNLPLKSHPFAHGAARAQVCARDQGKGDAMAEALFAAPPDALTPEGCEQIAAGVGCDVDRYRRDLPAAEARVAAEMAEVRAAGVQALPTLFIGDTRIQGAGASADQLADIIHRAAR